MDRTTIETVGGRPRSLLRDLFTARRCLRIASCAALAMAFVGAATAQAPRVQAEAARTPGTPSEALKLPASPGVPAPQQCPSRVILAGVPDNFSTANGAEPASPGPALQHLLAGAPAGYLVGFDVDAPNHGIAHTFKLPPCGCIVGAKLEFRAKALPDIPENDLLNLGNGNPRWWAHFGTGNPGGGPTLTNQPWTASTPPTTFTLDLGALPPGLPTTSLLSALQINRYLDFYVEDDTEIDYAKLTVQICDCKRCGPAKGSPTQQ